MNGLAHGDALAADHVTSKVACTTQSLLICRSEIVANCSDFKKIRMRTRVPDAVRRVALLRRAGTHRLQHGPWISGAPRRKRGVLHSIRGTKLNRSFMGNDAWTRFRILTTPCARVVDDRSAQKERAQCDPKRDAALPSREGAGKTGCALHPRSRVPRCT